jgi:hypothetical protein
MNKKKNITVSPNSSRRDFLVRLPMAAAALTLSSSFGFPVNTEQGTRRLFIKFDGVDGESKISRDGIYQFSMKEIESLRTGKLQLLKIKLELSYDRKSWQKFSTTITDRNAINQISEFAKKI